MATQIVMLTGDEARLLRSLDRVIKKESQIGQGIDRGSKKGQTAYQKFGKSASREIAKVATAYAGVQKAIQLVIDLNERVIATNKEAFSSIKGTKDGDRRLIQVAKDSADFKRLREKADSLSSNHGLDRNAARGLVFSARSGGFENAVDFIASNEQIIDVDEQARVATKLPKLFTGSGLTPQQAINATLAGARESELDFSQISKSLPQAAEGGRIVGASPAELIATQSVLSSLFKSQDTSADRIKLLATKLGLDDRTSGKGLLGGVAALQNLPAADRKKFLGDSQELNVAFKAFADSLERIKDQIPKVQQAIDKTGTAESITARRRAIAESDPKLAAELAQRKGELALEISREDRRGVREGNRQASVARGLTVAERDNVSPHIIALAERVSESTAGHGLSGASAGAIPLITGNSFANFERDLGFAFQGGDQEAVAALRAVSRLRDERTRNPNALLPKSEVATFAPADNGRIDASR